MYFATRKATTIVSARSASPSALETRTERPIVRLARENARPMPTKTTGHRPRGASSTASTPIPAAGHHAAVLPVARPTLRAPTPAR